MRIQQLSTMNVPIQFLKYSWRLDEVPTVAGLHARSLLSKETGLRFGLPSLTEEELFLHLEAPVKQFVVTIPMFLDKTIQRVFPGGTLLSLLQFLYDVYQEPMPVDELTPMLQYPQPHVVERFRGYIDRTNAGTPVRRIEMMYPNTFLSKIKRNCVEIDWS